MLGSVVCGWCIGRRPLLTPAEFPQEPINFLLGSGRIVCPASWGVGIWRTNLVGSFEKDIQSGIKDSDTDKYHRPDDQSLSFKSEGMTDLGINCINSPYKPAD
jgi:hypothetical protein